MFLKILILFAESIKYSTNIEIEKCIYYFDIIGRYDSNTSVNITFIPVGIYDAPNFDQVALEEAQLPNIKTYYLEI